MYPVEDLIRVAKMYYEVGYTQKEIAEHLSYSRPTVSRMIDSAIKEGIIKISIQYPISSVKSLENKLREEFCLKNVFVTPNYVKDDELINKDVGKHLAQYLYKIIKPNDTIGISWGTTLSYVTNHLLKKETEGIKVVQLNGGISRNSISTGSIALLETFSEAFQAEFHQLLVPTIVDSEEITRAILLDSNIRKIMELGESANIALFGIGQAVKDNILFKGGYFTDKEYDLLIQKGAVGDICSRYFDIEGNLIDPNLNNRTIGLQLNNLKEKEHSIAIAVGKDKVKAVYGAIQGGYLNTLFVDEALAKSLLKLKEDLNCEGSKVI